MPKVIRTSTGSTKSSSIIAPLYPISSLMRKNLIPKDEADNYEYEYFTLDLQIIQKDTIFKAANGHDVNWENSRAISREVHANTDNTNLFDLAKTSFGETSLWVHVKPSKRSRDGSQVLKLIWSNHLGVHALDKHNTKNHKDIRALAFCDENKRHNWSSYVLGRKKFHDVQTALVEQDFNDFTDCKKLTLLLNRKVQYA